MKELLYNHDDGVLYYNTTERVVKDVSDMIQNDGCVDCGQLAEYGLCSFYLYHIASFAFGHGQHIAEYILAWVAHKNNDLSAHLIGESMKHIVNSQNNGHWGSSDIVQIIEMVSFMMNAIFDLSLYSKVLPTFLLDFESFGISRI